jgi:homogentisate 1,2-dioxygenase
MAETIPNRPRGVLLPISTAPNVVVAGPVSIAANDTSQVIGMTLLVSSATEMGQLGAGSGEVAVMPRDVRFRATRPDDDARDLFCRNHGAMLRLPDLDLTGAKGLANARDFRAPAGWCEHRAEPTEPEQQLNCGPCWHEIACRFVGGAA